MAEGIKAVGIRAKGPVSATQRIEVRRVRGMGGAVVLQRTLERDVCTFKIEALRTKPVSLVGLMLSPFFDLVLGFLGGLVPVPLFAAGLELEAVALKRDSPRTMVGGGEGRRVP